LLCNKGTALAGPQSDAERGLCALVQYELLCNKGTALAGPQQQ